MQLSGLAEPEVEQLIQRATAVNPPPGLSATIHHRTEGNPLFVGEIIRLLPGEVLEEGQDYLPNIPEGVRDAIGRRLNRLSEDCNQVLTVASVIGRGFELGQLSRIAERSEEALLEALEEGLGASIIEEAPGSATRFQFSHALIQETLAGELSAARRVRLHARIGEALEEIYGVNVEAHASELAYHFAEAGTVLGTEKQVQYSRLAGEQALAAYAWEEAQALFERALTAKGVSSEGTDPARDVETAALLFGVARAQMAMAERHEILMYADAGDVERAVEVAEYPYLPVSGRSLGVAQLVVRALEMVSPESQRAGRLLARYGYLLGVEEGDYVGAQQAVAGALSIAEREGDTILEMKTLANSARVDRFHLDLQGTLRKSLRAIELARQHDDLFVEVAARYEASYAYLGTGEIEQARQNAVSMLEAAERLRDRFWLSSAHNRNRSLCYSMGDWPAARDFSNRSLAVAPRDTRNLLARAALEYQVDDFDQGSLHLERLLEVMRRTPPGTSGPHPALVIPIIARITGLPYGLEVAEAAALSVLSSPSAVPAYSQIAVAGLALLAVVRKDVAAAQQQYDNLQHGGTMGLITSPVFIAPDRLLGLLAETMADLDKAAQHFDDALAFCRKGYRPELAWTCCDYAGTLLQRQEPGDREKAMSLLDESLTISTALGMRPLMERVLSRQETFKA
jgi:tetratricopeptide (TPR) repeat protein